MLLAEQEIIVVSNARSVDMQRDFTLDNKSSHFW